MPRLRNLTICLIVALFSYATPSFCRELHFDSTDRYNIRWGDQEGDADLVKCRHGLTVGYSFGPACFKKGSYITVSLVLDDTPEDKVVVDWHHVENGLYRAIGVDGNGNVITEETAFMSLPVQEQGQGVGKVFIMGPLPDWIEWCVLKVRVIFVHQGKQGRVGVSALHWCEIFTVLDEPKAPMSPAWVSVLRISCRWARGETTPDGAADMLTQRLWENGIYDPRQRWYTRNETDSGETFYLKEFIEGGLRGQCNDFADFLVCLITSVGAYAARAQRTYSFTVVYGGPLDSDGSGWRLQTYLVDPAPPGESAGLPSQEFEFTYHQFTVFGSSVRDGTVKFSSGLALGWERDTTYKLALVKWFREWQNHTVVRTIGPNDPGNPWNPTPATGFIPEVTAADLP